MNFIAEKNHKGSFFIILLIFIKKSDKIFI